jgi:hypothetical protein
VTWRKGGRDCPAEVEDGFDLGWGVPDIPDLMTLRTEEFQGHCGPAAALLWMLIV